MSDVFTTDSIFSFINNRAEVKLVNDFDDLGNNIKRVKVKKIDKTSKFKFGRFFFKDSSDGSSRDHNIVNEFISISHKKKKGIVEYYGLVSFIEANGFITDISSEKYSSFNCTDIYSIVRKTKNLINLITELNKAKPDIKSILENSIQLLLSPSVTIPGIKSNIDASYTSYEYALTTRLKETGVISRYEYNEAELDPTKYYFDNTLFEFSENHINYEEDSKALIEQNEFLGHLLKWYKISHIDDIEGVILENFDDSFKDNIKMEYVLEIIRKLIKEDIDYNISGVVPKYDSSKMIGKWDIPNLISAIYYSIFYYNPNFYVLKKCQNPSCHKYFDVYFSNKKKKYCSEKCRNASNQRIYQMNKD